MRLLADSYYFGAFVVRTGQISAQEFMTFMISRETENVDSAQEVEEAFQAITAGGERPYVTKEELYQVDKNLYHTSKLIFHLSAAGIVQRTSRLLYKKDEAIPRCWYSTWCTGLQIFFSHFVFNVKLRIKLAIRIKRNDINA